MDAVTGGGFKSWRRRWDSLRLFTPARFSALPGLPFPASPGHLPGKDEVTDYARHFALPLWLGTGVRHLHQVGGGFEARTDHGTITARTVVVATGPFQQPPSRTWPRTSTERSPSSTPPTTATRTSSPTGRCSSSAPGTPACRSPKNSPARGR
ncbi:NAD(P)-binding domain-containing protein [Actinophytocola algeriensis]|uniref:Uncharacterized protein n=1 Tax=Actinophytocola algeriensis TaxID=1768010 RepID=A0A7W7VJM7_9PSEU|nr:NAD(P)-binding domain-containing protein [Actinophytocola algeriensis]MBB4912494.1 hypothetical protein [Actinophytocola algeriensis]MBE1480933.1 hypothetical protein [Actinophytocola algeriensis]